MIEPGRHGMFSLGTNADYVAALIEHVATFCVGSRRLYEWLHENHAVELLPVDEVNHPRIVAAEPNFVSINATTEVDLMGQCASETIAGKPWSSSGGQADFARGGHHDQEHRRARRDRAGDRAAARAADRRAGRGG